ncbi:hypothetical protein [Streptomyces paradoxus]|uniref:hypothetical protein n=1 Tax=Streptomyces paradoxus TaxID=66375 RepID=UPI0038007401
MKAILFGVSLGLLLLWPAALSLTIEVLAYLVAQPLTVAFALGLAAGAQLHRARRWAR